MKYFMIFLYKTNMANAHDTRNMMLNIEVKVEDIEKDVSDMKELQEKMEKVLNEINAKMK